MMHAATSSQFQPDAAHFCSRDEEAGSCLYVVDEDARASVTAADECVARCRCKQLLYKDIYTETHLYYR